MATWPSTLPQALNADGYTETQQSGVVRSSMDAGPDFVRRRFSAVSTMLSGNMLLTDTQWSTLMTFFNSTLAGGSIEFDWHPRGAHLNSPSTVYSMRFTAPPARRPASAHDLWQVELQLEILP